MHVHATLTNQSPNPVKYNVNLVLSNSVVPASIVISGILFATYQLFRVKQPAVRAGTNFIYQETSAVYLLICFFSFYFF